MHAGPCIAAAAARGSEERPRAARVNSGDDLVHAARSPICAPAGLRQAHRRGWPVWCASRRLLWANARSRAMMASRPSGGQLAFLRRQRCSIVRCMPWFGCCATGGTRLSLGVCRLLLSRRKRRQQASVRRGCGPRWPSSWVWPLEAIRAAALAPAMPALVLLVRGRAWRRSKSAGVSRHG